MALPENFKVGDLVVGSDGQVLGTVVSIDNDGVRVDAGFAEPVSLSRSDLENTTPAESEEEALTIRRAARQGQAQTVRETALAALPEFTVGSVLFDAQGEFLGRITATDEGTVTVELIDERTGELISSDSLEKFDLSGSSVMTVEQSEQLRVQQQRVQGIREFQVAEGRAPADEAEIARLLFGDQAITAPGAQVTDGEIEFGGLGTAGQFAAEDEEEEERLERLEERRQVLVELRREALENARIQADLDFDKHYTALKTSIKLEADLDPSGLKREVADVTIDELNDPVIRAEIRDAYDAALREAAFTDADPFLEADTEFAARQARVVSSIFGPKWFTDNLDFIIGTARPELGLRDVDFATLREDGEKVLLPLLVQATSNFNLLNFIGRESQTYLGELEDAVFAETDPEKQRVLRQAFVNTQSLIDSGALEQDIRDLGLEGPALLQFADTRRGRPLQQAVASSPAFAAVPITGLNASADLDIFLSFQAPTAPGQPGAGDETPGPGEQFDTKEALAGRGAIQATLTRRATERINDLQLRIDSGFFSEEEIINAEKEIELLEQRLIRASVFVAGDEDIEALSQQVIFGGVEEGGPQRSSIFADENPTTEPLATGFQSAFQGALALDGGLSAQDVAGRARLGQGAPLPTQQTFDAFVRQRIQELQATREQDPGFLSSQADLFKAAVGFAGQDIVKQRERDIARRQGTPGERQRPPQRRAARSVTRFRR